MARKGSWFSAVKKVFTPNSKEKLGNDSEKKSSKAKKKGVVRRETSSFLPIFREPSSIEKILGDVEREQLVFRPPTPPQQPKTPPFVIPRAASPRVASPRDAPLRVTSPRAASPTPRAPSPRVTSPRAASSAPRAVYPRVTSPRAASPAPRVTSPRAASPSPRVTSPRAASPAPRAASPAPRVTSPRAVSPAPKVTSPAPRVTSPRAASPTPRAPPPRIVRQQKPEPTLRHQQASAIKIQAAYRGYMARRSFKARKGLVRLQGVVKGMNAKRQTANAMKCMQLLVRVQSQVRSRRIRMLENQARVQGRNVKGTESASGKLSAAGNEDWDCSPLTKEEAEARLQRKVEAVVKRERAMAFAYSNKSWKETPRSAQNETLPGGFPWWWNWLEQQLPAPENDQETQDTKSLQLTPPTPFSGRKPSPRPQSRSSKKQDLGVDNNFDSTTPKSSRSTLALPCSTRNLPKYSRTGGYTPARDDESLTSCPPFSARGGYMAPTASARAKARASSNPRERFPVTPGGSETTESRRVSFPVMARGSKGSFFSNGDARFRRTPERQSVLNVSVDSTASLPAGVGRRQFNRFV